MKVALVQMPVWWTIDPPLGLAQMAGCLKAAGHEPHVFDLNILLWKDRPSPYAHMWNWEQFHFWNYLDVVNKYFQDNRALIETYAEKILRTDAPVIGFSVNIGSQLPCLAMAKLLKEQDASRLIVFGGQYFFLGDKARDMLSHPQVDVVVRGAADEVFPKLVSHVERTGRVIDRPGLVYRLLNDPLPSSPVYPSPLGRGGGEGKIYEIGSNKIVDTGLAPMPVNLDHVPFADFTGFPMELYTDPTRIPMSASRGCVWSCRFCSTREFWNNYSYMSGDRIFAEILHHRRLFPERTHIDFYDITANGRPEALYRFSQLVRDHHRTSHLMQIGWKINAILRPEMNAEILETMHDAGCMEIIYGVESGSPRVLKRMNKNYSVDVAERVLRDTHAAGITTTGNFMFGFPGETEEDFQMTLDFIRRNAASLDKAYASATFTSLEENSYLTSHQAEFKIKPSNGAFHSLYWESEDGANNYLVRMSRYVRFREMAISLDLEAYKGINGDLEEERLANMAQYYRYTNARAQAIEAYVDYLRVYDSEAMKTDLRSFRDELSRFPQAVARFAEWRERHADVPLEIHAKVWELAQEWLTDDKPFQIAQCLPLAGWLAQAPTYESFAKSLVSLHASLIDLRCHAVLSWDEGRMCLCFGRDRVEQQHQVDALQDKIDGALKIEKYSAEAIA